MNAMKMIHFSSPRWTQQFSGNSDPATQIISQLVMVEPNSRYRLHFAARSESIVSGGLPRVAVVGPANKEIPGQTNAFPESVSNWQDYSIDFNSKETTSAIRISLQPRALHYVPLSHLLAASGLTTFRYGSCELGRLLV